MPGWLRQIGSWIGWLFLGPLRSGLGRLRRRRVPVLLQMTAVECGPACLAMILNYHGRNVRVAECRESCGVGRDGITGRTLAQMARQHGLRVRALSLEPAHFQDVALPAIAHWNFNHFVVVEHWSPTHVVVVDPALGRRRLTAAEFAAGFTGVVLTLEPGVEFERRSATAPGARRRYLKYFLSMPGTRGLLAQVLAASLFLQVLGLALPIFTQVVVDHILPFHLTSVMTMLGLGMVLLVVTVMATSYLRSALLIYLQTRLDAQLMLGFFEHVLRLPFRFFQQRTSGDLLMRLGSNTTIREILTSRTLSVVLDGGLVLTYLTLLLVWKPLFGGVVLGIGALQVALLLCTTRRMHELTQHQLATQAESQSYLVEALKGIATLKASGGEERAFEHWSNLFFKNLNVSLQRSQLSLFVETAMAGLRLFSPLLLLWVGALQVLDGTLSLGTMLALTALAATVLAPLASLVSTGQQLQLVRAHLERVADVVEAEPEQQPHEVLPAPPLTGRIEVKRVNFRYDPQAPLVLREISITIEAGQKVALVGRTGSGKSTLALLLLGLYPPTEGEILYDGIPLPRLNYRTLRSQCGVVLQEPFLFSGSIRQSITSQAPDLSFEDMTAAARLAAVHDEIVQMPLGYDTPVAERGSSLSGGQRQRLALARALAHRPAILVLDEATSHLDVATEQQVDRNLSQLSCTRIVIAHRLSTIANADLILVLEQGVIVERGSHAELLARGGHYTALVHRQREGAETTGATAPAATGRRVRFEAPGLTAAGRDHRD